MVLEGKVSVDKRIAELKERLTKLQSGGHDVGKAMESLAKMEKVASAASGEDLERALSKFESYMDRLEKKLSSRKRKVKSPSGEPESKENGKKADTASGKETPPDSEKDDIGQEKAEVQKEEKTPKEEDVSGGGKETDIPAPEGEKEEAPEEQKAGEEKEAPAKEMEETSVKPKEEAPKEQKAEEKKEAPAKEMEETSVKPEEEAPEKQKAEEKKEAPAKEMEETSVKPEEEAPKEQKAEEKKEAPAPDPKHREMTERVKELEEITKALGGDSSPILAHIKAMDEALESGNVQLFQQYHDIARDWFEKYLNSLLPPVINDHIADIRALESQYLDMGKQDRLEGKIPDITRIMNSTSAGDIDAMIVSWRTLGDSLEEIKKDLESLSPDLEEEMSGSMSRFDGMLAKVPDENVKKSFRERMEKLKAESDILSRYASFRSIMRDLSEEADTAEKKKFEKILLSVEPLIQRTAELKGDDCEEYSSLIREKDRLLSLFATDIEGAMKGMEGLLDRAALEVAQIEENKVQDLMKVVKELENKLSDLSGMMDVEPAARVHKLCQDKLENGDIAGAEELLEKARSIFEKLKERSIRDQARKSLDEIVASRKQLEEKGIDTSPLEEPLSMAEKALDSGDMLLFEENMEALRERIGFMRKEELKVEYQQLLISIMNAVKEMRDRNEDVAQFEKGLDEIRELSLSGNLGECIEKQRTLLKELMNRKLSEKVEERIAHLGNTVSEAEGLMIETDEPRKMMEQARELNSSGDVEKALDIITEAQVMLEERMTRRSFSLIEKQIRDLAAEGKEYSLEAEDIDGKIGYAYNLADEERFKEAMEHLYGIKNDLTAALNEKKAARLMEEISNRIKTARSLGMRIASFKAAQTKAKVLLDAGDMDSVIDLLERQIREIDKQIEERKGLQSRLDELRGHMIGIETKIQKLVDNGMSVASIRERMERISELIEASDADGAEMEMSSVEAEIDSLLSGGDETRSRQPESGKTGFKESPTTAGSGDRVDAETAKNQLQSLVAGILEEVKRRNIKGMDTSSLKKDIERIQNLVIMKDYTSAYEAARNCLDSIISME